MRNGEWDKDSEMVGEPRSKQRATNNNTSQRTPPPGKNKQRWE